MNTIGKIPDKIKNSAVRQRMKTDDRYRITLTASISLAFHLAYAFYNGGLGVFNRSLWFVALCAYYVMLSILRFSALLWGRKSGAGSGTGTEYFVMKFSGVLLTFLSILLVGVAYLSLSQNVAVKYDEIMMITIAAYIFYKLTMTIIQAIRRRKSHSPLFAVIQTIGYAEVAVSVFTLQRSMLVSFGSMDHGKAYTLNLFTGAAVCLFVLALGVIMIIKGVKKADFR